MVWILGGNQEEAPTASRSEVTKTSTSSDKERKEGAIDAVAPARCPACCSVPIQARGWAVPILCKVGAVASEGRMAFTSSSGRLCPADFALLRPAPARRGEALPHEWGPHTQ